MARRLLPRSRKQKKYDSPMGSPVGLPGTLQREKFGSDIERRRRRSQAFRCILSIVTVTHAG
jgi:hypothetical protein